MVPLKKGHHQIQKGPVGVKWGQHPPHARERNGNSGTQIEPGRPVRQPISQTRPCGGHDRGDRTTKLPEAVGEGGSGSLPATKTKRVPSRGEPINKRSERAAAIKWQEVTKL